MTDNERAVIEAAVEWAKMREFFGERATTVVLAAKELTRAVSELHNEHDGKWEPGND